MFAFTVGALLLVRRSLVYGSDAFQASTNRAVGTNPPVNRAGNQPYQIRLSQETFEWLKTVLVITQPGRGTWNSDGRSVGSFRGGFDEGRDFHLINPGSGTSDDILVQKALGALATAIKQQILWESGGTVIAQRDIVGPTQQVVKVLGPVIVWKAAASPVHDSDRIEHLIIRQVNNSDAYEWVSVSQPKHKYCSSNDEPFKLRPIKGSVIEWKFTADQSGGRRLSEICSVFAEQQIQKRQRELRHARHDIVRDTGPTSGFKLKSNLHHLSLRLDSLFSLYVDLRAIIQRERDQQIPNEEIKKQMEEQLRSFEAERTSMIAQLEALENRRVETQKQLDECQRKEKETNHLIMIAALIGGAVMLTMSGIFIFVLCRKAGKRMIDTSEEMKRELGVNRERKFMDYPLPNRQPGSVAIDVAEMDPQFRCSRDPQVAALRHSVLVDENGQFGFNQIDEVTELEGINVSAVTRQSTIGNAEEGELVIQAIKEGVKGAVERKQKRQMLVEPLKEIMQNAVVVQDEVIAEIVEVMETDKEQEPERLADQ